MSFTPETLSLIRQDYERLPFGHKRNCLEQWSRMLGCSYQKINDAVKTTHRARKGEAQRPEYQGWAKVVYTIKKRPPEEAGFISTEDALALAIRGGHLPSEAVNMPVGTIDRIARENGWTKTEVRANRFQAERPNQAHHFDASSSKFLYVAKDLGGGDYLLKLHRPAKHYKNKPVPVDRLRPWVYGLTDDHSGRFIARYVAALGESAKDSMQFICWAWSEIGLPEQLLADQGMLKKSLPSQDLHERLGIEFPQMMPYQKRGHGKIERPWRTLWQKFELPFYSALASWDKFEITLSELNAQLQNYIDDKYNTMPHRFERGITRMQAWGRIALSGGLVKMPEHTLRTIAGKIERTVSVEGIVRLEGDRYEVVGLHSARVEVLRSVFDNKLVARDMETGIKYNMRDFKPLDLGEYRAYKETPHQQLVNASAEASVSREAMLYASGKPADEKVISMPIRTKEERAIVDPLDVTTYANIAEGINEFVEIAGALKSAQEKEVVEAHIKSLGLDKQAVRDFALEVRANIEEQRSRMAM